MTFNLNAYLEEHKKIIFLDNGDAVREFVPHIKCIDGFEFSVQVHIFYEPYDNDGPYVTVLVGNLSKTVVELLPYALIEITIPVEKLLEDRLAKLFHVFWQKMIRLSVWLRKIHPILFPWLYDWAWHSRLPVMDHPINTIYPYTPVEIVEKIVEDHGGLWAEERTGIEPALEQGM